MSARGVFFVAVLAALPPQCAKMMGQKPAASAQPDPAPTPTPVVITSATTPPIWHPPEPPAPAGAASGAASAAPSNVDLAKAKAAAEAKDFKKVRSLLEKKVKGGKSSTEEAELLAEACQQLKDKACLEAVKKAHASSSSGEASP